MRNDLNYSDAGKIGAEKTKKILQIKRENSKSEYYKNPKLCINCGCIIPFEKRFNKGCSASCSTIYSNKIKGKRSENTKNNISNGLYKYYKSQKSLNENRKLKNFNKKDNIKICKYCGQPLSNEYDHSICKKFRLFNSLEKFGFDKSTIGTINLFNEYNRIKQLIEDFYLLNGSNANLLKENFNYLSGSANFHKLLKSLNIQSRNNSESLKEAYLTGRFISNTKNQYKSEWHTTWDGKEVYLRSSYESDYADELDKQKIKYEVESLRIKYFNSQLNEYHCAIPDFYLPETNTIIEIKSSWTLNIDEMKDKVKAYKELGYNFKLMLEHEDKTNLII